jgi:polyphosphate kinase
MQKREKKLINRELSWLSFNARVLQEAADPSVPLLERIKFLGIFSNNQDEFFRVRVATNKRMLLVKKGDFDKGINKELVKETLQLIQKDVLHLQKKFDTVFFQLLDELKKEKIFWVNENKLTIAQQQDIKRFFKEELLSTLFPLILDEKKPFPHLKDSAIYLAVKMSKTITKEVKYAIVEIPTQVKGRFYVLPSQDNNKYIVFMDDVIRINLKVLFSIFDYDVFEAFTIKITRDAEIDLELDISENMYEKIKKAIEQRRKGQLVRFVYDKEMPKDLLEFLLHKMGLTKDAALPGQRYHNFKDLMKFPQSKGVDSYLYQPIKQIPIPELDAAKTLFDKIKAKDYLLHHPYQSFDYVVRFLREAAVDPKVTAISISLYRVAEHSNVVNALINAVKNGKKVFVMMELKARFDEESNIYWSNKLLEAGAEVFFGYERIKVHSKICLVYRKEDNGMQLYAHIGTGNYNGQTARLYGDHGLFTSDKRITADLRKVFDAIRHFESFKPSFKHILVSPYNNRSAFLQKIDREISLAKTGKKAWLKFKMNNLVDKVVIDKLYEASQAGVEIFLIVRGICCLIPGVDGMSEKIQAISIIDRFLEHTRLYIFGNNGNPELYFGSADLMSRNLDNRIEVVAPILDADVKTQLLDFFEIQWNDNVKARTIDASQSNKYRVQGVPRIRSQEEFLAYLQSKYLPM